MQLNTITATLLGRQKSQSRPTWPPQQPARSFFEVHPAGSVLRSLFLSSLLWVFLAFTLYSVYSFVVAAN